VILTISSTGPKAGDLSFLFHKHPGAGAGIALSFGRALVFYPRYDANACEIALILDLDPLSLVGRAFTYFAEHGVERVVCEQKHMGSRAVVIVGRSASVIRQRFGFLPEHEVRLGIVYTRDRSSIF
jgi:hypothetical protein